MCKLAVKQYGYAIQYIDKDLPSYKDLCKLAVQQNSNAIKYINENQSNYKELYKLSINQEKREEEEVRKKRKIELMESELDLINIKIKSLEHEKELLIKKMNKKRINSDEEKDEEDDSEVNIISQPKYIFDKELLKSYLASKI